MPLHPPSAAPTLAVALAAFALTLMLPVAAHAQASAALPELPAASRAMSPAARASAVAGPRARSPVEAAKNATPPGELRPERPVAPQLRIPFGKVPPAPKRDATARPGGAAKGGIDDAAARCESQPDAQLRADCRAGLAPAPKPAP